MALISKLIAIANEIRMFGELKGKLTLTDMEMGISQVYEKGNARGYQRGESDGREAEHKAFWDSYQNNGLRTNYYSAFERSGWTDVTFKPRYDIKPNSSHLMFQHAKITNLTEALRTSGVTLDTSKSIGFNNMFYQSTITHIPTIDFTGATSKLVGVFSTCPVQTIEKIILKEDGTNTFQDAFLKATCLENITVAGVIGNSIDFQACPLSAASVQSILDALKDLTGQTAQTLTLNAAVGAALTDGQKATIAEKNWTLVY